MVNSTDDPKFNHVFTKSMELSNMLTMAAMESVAKLFKIEGNVTAIKDDEERSKALVHVVQVGLGVIAGTIKATSKMVARDKLSQDAFLFTAILTALCMEPVINGNDDDGLQFDYGIHKIVEALEFIEKATGRRIDDCLIKALGEAARDTQKLSSGALDEFLKARAASKEPPAAH